MTDRTKILLLIAVAGVAAILVNCFRANGLPWLADPEAPVSQESNLGTSIELDELLYYLNRGSAFLVDARHTGEFVGGHVVGAVNLPAGRKIEHLDRVFEMLPPDELIIIYGEEYPPRDSWELAGFLIKNGFNPKNLRVFEPGWKSLKNHQDIPIAGERP
jgi:rhodanese-related sulfurtransferase